MYSLLVLVSLFVAILLIIVVLLQSSKGGGLAGTFGGGGGQFGTVFGTRRTADFLSKATWWLAGSLLVIAIIVNLFFLPSQVATSRDSIIQSGTKQTVPQSPVLPQQQSTEAPAGK